MNNRLNKISIPLAFITAGAMLSACSEADEQTAATPGDNAIRFAAGAEYASRAASDITTNNLSEFAVYAYTGSATDPPVVHEQCHGKENRLKHMDLFSLEILAERACRLLCLRP